MTDDREQDISQTSEDRSMTNKNNKEHKKDGNEDLPNEATVRWTDIFVCGICGRKSLVTTEAPVNYRFDMNTNAKQHIWFKLERKEIKPRTNHCLHCSDSPVGRYEREKGGE